MGGALVEGWVRARLFAPEGIFVVEPVAERRKYLESLKVRTLSSFPEPLPEVRFVLWAVKPHLLPELIARYAPGAPLPLHISIAAGVPLKRLAKEKTRWVRAMPNQPVLVGEGATALYTDAPLKGEERTEVERLFSPVGRVLWVEKEEDLHGVTALSGSGPAYVALFAEALEDAGVMVGLPREVARTLSLQTLKGAAMQMEREGIAPAALKEKVASPGGTTARALYALEKGGFRAALLEAVRSAWERSRELAGEKEKP